MTWKLKKPVAETISGWEDWHSNAKSSHPVKYFLQVTVADKLDSLFVVRIKWPIRDVYWKFKHTYIKKHQYNTIRPRTLKVGYHDPVERILHGVMEDVVQFVEHGMPHIDFEESSPEHKAIKKELDEIYHWWTELWPNRDDFFVSGGHIPDGPDLPKEWGFMAILNEKYDDEPIMLEYKKYSGIRSEARDEWLKEEDRMLIRVMNARHYMWFV